jgi:membrane protease YdiL (CAAX protease family)
MKSDSHHSRFSLAIITLLTNNPSLIAWGYLFLISLAEIVTILVEPRWGLTLYFGVLFMLLTHASLVWDQPLHHLLLSLTLAPLNRIFSLCLPLTPFPVIYWYLIISVPLFVAIRMVIKTLKLSPRSIGLSWGSHLWLQLFVTLTGLGLGYVEYLILAPKPLIQELTLQQFVIPSLILLVSTGFLEELLFRGVMQPAAVETLARRGGILYIALLFTILHIGYQSVADLMFVFIVGLYFGWVVDKTNSLLGVTLAHGLVNIFLFLIFPFY